MNREKSKDEAATPPEDIDVAVILTNGFDGDLVKRSIRQALGREIEVVGGWPTNERSAADGAAIDAFNRITSWRKMRGHQEYEAGTDHDEL